MKVSARRRKGFAHSITIGHHTLVVDEPEERGGADTGPTPGQLLAASLATCTAITVEMYADRKGWDLGELEVDVDYEPDSSERATHYEVVLRVPGDLDDEELESIETIAGKCPVHRALTGGQIEVTDRVERA
jgi:putative redox protein